MICRTRKREKGRANEVWGEGGERVREMMEKQKEIKWGRRARREREEEVRESEERRNKERVRQGRGWGGEGGMRKGRRGGGEGKYISTWG